MGEVPRTPGVTESGIEDCKQDEFDGLVRKNSHLDKVTPCKECNYCNICPPISGLEYLINQFNLCHVSHE